jgi:cytoskeletal protein RodZ
MRRNPLLPAVVLTTMAIFLTGCSRNPVAPSVDPSAGPGAGTTAIGTIPDDPPPSDGGTPSSRTETFNATSEGTLTVGRWTLWIRKNSLTGDATITMHVSDPEAMDVQIDVQPASANNFQSPVVLTANTSDVAGFDYSTGTMQYWGNGDWQQATDVSSHPNQQNVVGRFTTLANTQVTNSTGKKGKLGA